MCSLFFDFVKVGVGPVRIEYLVAVHDGNEVFGVGEVDDVVGVTGEHDDTLDFVTTHLVVEDFVRALLAELDEAVARDDDELFPLGVVPMLALGDTRLRDVDAHLSAVEGVDEFGERTTLVNIHLQVEDGLFFGQVAQEGAIETLGKGVGGNLGNHQGLGHIGKLMEQGHDFTKGCFMGDGTIAVAAYFSEHRFHRLNRFFIIRATCGITIHGNDFQTIKLAMVLLALQGVDHLFHKVIDVEQFKFYTWVVDRDGEVIGDVVAEGSYGTIIIGTAPFAVEVGETIHQYFGTCFRTILQEQVLASLLATTILTIAEAASQGGLLRTGEHHRASVLMSLQCVKQGGGKAEVTLHELVIVLGAVYASEIEHEVTLLAPCVKLLGGGIEVEFEDFLDRQVAVATGLAVFDVIELGAKVLADEAFGTSY